MNSPDQDPQLPEQVSRALAADQQAPSAETDRSILQFARQQTPTTPSQAWKTWMPAAAAGCLVGVLTLSLLPEQASESVQSMDVDTQLTTDTGVSRQAIPQSAMEKGRALADAIPAEESMLVELEAMPSTAAPSVVAAISSPAPAQASAIVRLKPEFYQRLVALNHRENAVMGFSDDMSQPSAGNATLRAAKKSEQRAAEFSSATLKRAKMSPEHDSEAAYKALLSDCNCGLPESLRGALDMLRQQKIQLEENKRPATDTKQ